MYWFIDAFYKFAVFRGRSSRAAFWWFVLFGVLFNIVLGIGDSLLDTSKAFNLGSRLPQVLQANVAEMEELRQMLTFGLLESIYLLLLLIPGLALLIRRLHDVGRSGWWFWIGLVPFLGVAVLFIFTLLGSQTGTNKYGPNPYDNEFGSNPYDNEYGPKPYEE